jgi:hypothetical protein
MNDPMPEGVIYCATHRKPLGECRHPVLGGGVAEANKPVTQRERMLHGHMRAFVTREEVVPLTDAEAVTRERSRGEGDRTVVLRDGKVDEALTARYHANHAEGLRLAREEQLRMLREVQDIAQAPHGPTGHVPAGLALEREILDELHRRTDELHIPPFDPEALAALEAKLTAAEERLLQLRVDEYWSESGATLRQAMIDVAAREALPTRRPSWWERHVTWPLLRLRAWLTGGEGHDG